ncbi:MBL fold metallo-hydrolase [Candidatus Thorarchaeota archaeon]|nr:MAG: MBL fold metallo-hydrolase [Candidatus Thorarchaeota archaeon]
MKVTMLGTGTSYPDSDRVQSGILIEIDGKRILFDIGAGVYHRLIQLGVDLKSISTIFITHFHIDHCSDFLMLCQNLWLDGHDKPLNIYGPPAIKQWYRGLFDIAFPYARDRLMINVAVLKDHEAVHVGEASISNVPTVHGTMETRALRLEWRGLSLVYSSDTAPCREVIDLAKGADVLIHECNWLDGPNPEGVHTTPSQLAEIIEEAVPKKVVLTHVSPDVVSKKEKVLEIVSRRTNAEVVMGEDLMYFEV